MFQHYVCNFSLLFLLLLLMMCCCFKTGLFIKFKNSFSIIYRLGNRFHNLCYLLCTLGWISQQPFCLPVHFQTVLLYATTVPNWNKFVFDLDFWKNIYVYMHKWIRNGKTLVSSVSKSTAQFYQTWDYGWKNYAEQHCRRLPIDDWKTCPTLTYTFTVCSILRAIWM